MDEVAFLNPILSWSDSRFEIVKIGHLGVGKVAAFGESDEYCDVGIQTLSDINKLELPPLLLDKSVNELDKKILLGIELLDAQLYHNEYGSESTLFRRLKITKSIMERLKTLYWTKFCLDEYLIIICSIKFEFSINVEF